MTQEKTVIRINWRGPFAVKDDREPGAKKAKLSIGSGNRASADTFHRHGQDIGVYQIYGKHMIYGDNVLLYIGMAPRTSFTARIGSHMRNWGVYWDPNNTVHVGRLNMRDWENPASKPDAELIEAAEKLLIHHHSPAFNAGNVGTLYWRQNKISEFLTHNNVRVKNEGSRGCLERTVRSLQAMRK